MDYLFSLSSCTEPDKNIMCLLDKHSEFYFARLYLNSAFAILNLLVFSQKLMLRTIGPNITPRLFMLVSSMLRPSRDMS